jgi:hypothetical protein
MAAIYAADVWCDGCADDIKDRIAAELFEGQGSVTFPDGWVAEGFDSVEDVRGHLDSMSEHDYDSDDYPKGCSDDEESDCPQHCGALDDCVNAEEDADGTRHGYFFGNALTSYGDDYVREAVIEALESGRNDSVALTLWKPCYDYIDYGPKGICVHCGDYAELDDMDECEDCINEDGSA